MTVPRYGEQQVAVEPLPTVRVPTNVPLQSLGSFPHIDISHVEKAADDVWQREKQKADQISVLNAEARAADLETHILYDPEKGVLNMKGRNALDSRQAFQDQWTKGLSEINKDLHNDTQRQAFQRASLTRYASMNDTVSRHTHTEMQAYDDETVKSAITKEGNAAAAAAVRGVSFSDAADRSTMAIARQRATILDYAQRQGMSDESTQLLLEQTTSRTHSMVLERMLANEDDITAKKYFNEFKDEFKGQDLITASKAVEAGSTRGESQRLSDDIMTKHQDDPTGALAEVKKITDPVLRDATEARVTHEFELRSALKREHENDLYNQATNLIEPLVRKGTPFIAANAIPANIWDQLPLTARNALDRRALHADSDYPNNATTWHDFLELTPSQLGGLNKLEFETKYWQNFDRETRTRAELMWSSARDAQRTGKFDAKMAADESFKDLVKNAMGNIDPVFRKKTAKDLSSDQYQFYTDFTIEAMRRKEAAEQAKGKPATRAEMQDIIDQVARERVFTDKTFGRDTYAMPGRINRDDKNRSYVPFSQIPENIRQELDSMVPKTAGDRQRKLERLYAARVLDDAALFRSILKEK